MAQLLLPDLSMIPRSGRQSLHKVLVVLCKLTVHSSASQCQFLLFAAADLDAAFARLSNDNYRELLAKHRGSLYVPQPDAGDCVYRILTAERNAIMAHSLRAVADVEGPAKTVVAVVGGSYI